MRRLLVLLTCCAALAAVPSLAAAQEPTGGAAPAAEPGAGTATTAQIPRRVRVAYLRWRSRLQRHDLYVGRTLLPEVRASDGTARSPTAAELRGSIHRMQRRWGRWLRTTKRGEAVSFKLKVRRKVPAWGKQYLRAIAACESHRNPRAVGGGGAYRGMYQFSVSTWYVVGGTGDPAAASRWEQTWRAWLLLSRHGSGHWPNCG
jgi:Transglycosylase-like domain